MFTGLVEDVGRVADIRRGAANTRLAVETRLKGIKVGDSVAVNGACLTAVEIRGNTLWFDVSRETLERTNLRFLQRGDFVNLERALTLEKPLGGHIVQGHVDTLGRIEELKPLGEHHLLKLRFEERFSIYTVEKGSIAVDGISLTINRVGDGWVEINVIPHTFGETNLKYRKRGDFVNLEFDIFGKYVVNYLQRVGRKFDTLRDFLNLG